MPQLVPFYFLNQIISSMSNVITNSSPSPILLSGLVLVLVIILLCTESGSSTNQSLKQEQDQTVKIPRTSQENPPLVDLTYVDKRSPRTGIIKKVVVDLNDAEGLRLRDLWPQSSYPLKPVTVGNTVRVGLEMPDNTLHDYRLAGTRYPEVQQHGHIGIWVSAMMNPNLFNIRVVTRGSPVETAPIQAYSLTTVGTGTGQTMKSFIRK